MRAMEMQCAKRSHYDFGLRFQMGVLRHAGRMLTLDPSLDETGKQVFEAQPDAVVHSKLVSTLPLPVAFMGVL